MSGAGGAVGALVVSGNETTKKFTKEDNREDPQILVFVVFVSFVVRDLGLMVATAVTVGRDRRSMDP